MTGVLTQIVFVTTCDYENAYHSKGSDPSECQQMVRIRESLTADNVTVLV